MIQHRTASVLVVDDLEAWRHQVREILRARPEWRIIAEACDGVEAVQKSTALQPDIILLDIGLPKLNGIEAARRIRQRSLHAHIVFVTQDRDKDIRDAALGIKGTRYILKADAASELVPAIASVLADRYPAAL